MSRRRQAKSAAWRRRQEADAHVRAARADGYRSRAAYKLKDIARARRLLRRGMAVVDLGAAPGGWSQVAAAAVGAEGRVAAIDLLPLAPLDGVMMMQGDFTDAAARARLQAMIGGAADVVLSDMAPNLSGIAARDQANARALFCAALDYCIGGGLKDGGAFLVKTFAGEAHDDCRRDLQPLFAQVQIITPPATRKASRECYLLARGFNPTVQ